MTEQPSAVPSRAPIAGGAAALAMLIAGAVASVEPATTASEGEQFVAYRDDGGVATICRGHTGPEVHLGMRATPEQCRAWYRADMTKAMRLALAATPTLAEQRSALEAAGDFTLNAGPGWWRRSPMAARFAGRDWRAGCKAFRGYIVLYRAPRDVPGRACRRDRRGVLYCELPGLVRRREGERTMCLAGLPA